MKMFLNKILIGVIISFCIFTPLLSAYSAGSGVFTDPNNIYDPAAKTGSEGGYSVTDTKYGIETEYGFLALLGLLISWFLIFLSLVFFVLIIYAGVRWILARGNEEEINKAKETIKSAVIGLVIAFAAYAIVSFIAGTFDVARNEEIQNQSDSYWGDWSDVEDMVN